MTHKRCVCWNCGDVYAHQTSGHGCSDQPSSGHYCGTCQTALNEALARIPKKRKWVWVPVTDEAERSAIIQMWDAEDERNRNPPTPFGELMMIPQPRRVGSPLFDMETGKKVQEFRVFETSKGRYNIGRYHKDSQPAEITREMQEIIATGEIV